MIIDTTQTKIERRIEQKQEETDIFKALLEAADRRKYIEDEGGCSCHISPPCSYCVSHSKCAICNEVVLNDDLVKFNNDWICEECRNEQ